MTPINSPFIQLLRTSRPFTSSLSGVLSLAVLFFAGPTFMAQQGFRIIPIVLVTMVGFISNDIYDRRKDALSGNGRPIALGLLSRADALLGLCVLSVGAIMIELFVGNLYSTAVLLATLVAVLLYSPIAARLPLLKDFYTAGLSVTPLLYGVSITGAMPNALPFVIIGAFIIGRELVLDVLDLDGDMRSGVRTVPSYIGHRLSTLIGWTLMITSVSFLTILPALPLMRALGVGAVAMLLVCLLQYRTNERKAIALSRVPMLAGALVIASLLA